MILCAGELLADITASGSEMRRRAAGAPFNVACDIAALGGEAAFYGCAGRDGMGDWLAAEAEKCGAALMLRRSARSTPLAFVELLPGGERRFSFRAERGADCELEISDIADVLGQAEIFHFGSLMLRSAKGRRFAAEAAAAAHKAGAAVSFDVNLRHGLYPSVSAAVGATREAVALADIIKLSEEEAALLTGEADAEAAAKLLSEGKTAFVTLGEKGAYAARGGECVFMPARPAEAVDATGAGDAFFAAALLELSRSGDIKAALSAGTEAGALAVTLNASNFAGMKFY